MKLEHNRLLPTRGSLPFPNRKTWFSSLLGTNKCITKVNFSGAVFMQPPHSFTTRPQHMAMLTTPWRHLCPMQLCCRISTAPQLSRISSAGGSQRETGQNSNTKTETTLPTRQAVSKSPQPPSLVLIITEHPTPASGPAGTREQASPRGALSSNEQTAPGPEPPTKAALHPEDGTLRAMTAAEGGERRQGGRESSCAPAKHP